MKHHGILAATLFTLFSAGILAVQGGSHRPHHRPCEIRNYAEKHHGKGLAGRRLLRTSHRYDFFRDFPRVELPDSVDLRTFAELAPVLNQGQAGTCWAHSLIETLWDSLILAGRAPPSALSVQYLVDAGAALGYGCQGGNMDASMYLLRPFGAPSAILYPYSDENCGEQSKKCPILASGLQFVEFEPSDYNMMYVLSVLKLPISMTVAAGAGPWENYGGGTYKSCTYARADHMIELVAINRYGGAFDAQGNLPFMSATGVAKNSWTNKWGESGYIETVLRDSSGEKCNNFTQEVGYFVLPGTAPGPLPVPPPPAPTCRGFLCGLHCFPWCRKE